MFTNEFVVLTMLGSVVLMVVFGLLHIPWLAFVFFLVFFGMGLSFITQCIFDVNWKGNWQKIRSKMKIPQLRIWK